MQRVHAVDEKIGYKSNETRGRFGFVLNLIRKSLVSMVFRDGDGKRTAKKVAKTALSCCCIRCVSFNDQPRPKTLISDDITNSSH